MLARVPTRSACWARQCSVRSSVMVLGRCWRRRCGPRWPPRWRRTLGPGPAGAEVPADQIRAGRLLAAADRGGPVRPRLARVELQLPHQLADQLRANLLAVADQPGVDPPIPVHGVE